MWLSGNNPTSIHEDVGSIPGLTHWAKGSSIALSRGVGHRGWNPLLLRLWYRPAAAAQIQPLVWEFPYAAYMPPPKKRKERRKEERKK